MKNILLLSATLVLASCSEEVHDHEESNVPSNIKREKVNFKEFSENENAFAVYKNLKTTSSKTQSNSKTVNLDSLDFEVNFNNGLHLSYANLESYTFPIRRTFNNGLLENLVINEHTDGKYYAKLLKYNLTAQERINLSNGVLLGLQNPIITEELGEYEFENQIQSTGCGSITIKVITACANGHTIRSQCNLTGSAAPQIKTITIAIDCNDSPNGGGGDGSAGYYGNLFNNGGSSAGGSGGSGSGYITPSFPNNLTPTDLYQNGISEPVLDIGYENKPIDVFFANLTYEQQQWVYVQSEVTKQSIENYLTANNFSNESQDYIEEAINYCETNGNTPEVLEENNNTLSLLTNGTINGLPVDLGDSTPITNMANYLSCFNTTQGAILTIAADQPVAGTHNLFLGGGTVGHSFITIKQGNKVRSLGFYPVSGAASLLPNLSTPADPNDFINVPGEFHNNQNTVFDVSLSVNISAVQFTNLINGTIAYANSKPIYNLSALNCTDMAIIMFEANTNINIPSCESPRILWDGQTPGTLGEVLRDLPTSTGGTKDTNGGTSPPNNG